MRIGILTLACALAAATATAETQTTNEAAAVVVSVGPIAVTNVGCVTLAPETAAWKGELAAEINRAKTELAEQNRERMDVLGEKYDAKCRNAVKEIKDEANGWYEKLKGVFDSRLNIFTWVLGILVTICGVVVPLVMGVWTWLKERERQKEYATLKKSLEKQQKAQEEAEEKRQKEYMELYEGMRNAMNTINDQHLYTALGICELRIADTLRNSYDRDMNGKGDLRPYQIVSGAMRAIEYLTPCPLQTENLKLAIRCLWCATESMKKAGKLLGDVKKALDNRAWNVTPAQVEGRLGNGRDNKSGKTYVEMFEEFYATYGKPKEEAK